jgi:transposase
VDVSSVKRYVAAAYREWRSLAPKKRPGSEPKLDDGASKLLEANLEEHPEASLPHRREFLQVWGVSVTDPTAPRTLRRMGFGRKRSLDASERHEWLRATWRTLVAEGIQPERLVFVDELGANASLASL